MVTFGVLPNMTRTMTHAIRRTAAPMVLSLLLAACRTTVVDPFTPPGNTITLPLGAEVALAPGGSVAINPGGLVLTFVAVTGDSRCPLSVQCIHAGSAQVSMRATITGVSRDLNLETTVKDTVTVDRYLLRLVSVAPVPVTTTVIPASSYRATLRVTSK